MSRSIESAMGLSRRFLNLFTANGIPGVKSLCSIDLTHQPFFNPTTPPQPPNGNGSESEGPPGYASPQTPAAGAGDQKNKLAEALMMEQFRVPRSSFTFRASAPAPNDQWRIDCFPLADRKVICADQSGRAFRFDAQTRQAGPMPNLHKPKSMPLSLFVPNADADNRYDHNRPGSSLFVMERIPKLEVGCSAQHSEQFEVFVYRRPRSTAYIRSWHCELLPPPPYVREPNCWDSLPEISSYAVLGDGSHICVSFKGVGTYYLDTVSHTWSEFHEWTLPFHGRVEYVPELKLWFGLSAEAQHLAAADLSAMDHQPQLLGPWKELDMPEEWKECKDSQLVNLGSGRFCIARFFQPRILNGGDELPDQNFTVLTGVEVVPCVHDANDNANSSGSNGIVELRMIPHKSRCHISNGTTIDSVF